MSYTLSDGLWSAGDCDSPLRRVRQHVSCHLNLSARGLHITRQQRKQRLFIAGKEHAITQNEMVFQALCKLPRTHFDMQGAAASQIAMCAPIFEEAYTNIVHAE